MLINKKNFMFVSSRIPFKNQYIIGLGWNAKEVYGVKDHLAFPFLDYIEISWNLSNPFKTFKFFQYHAHWKI